MDDDEEGAFQPEEVKAIIDDYEGDTFGLLVSSAKPIEA